MLKLASGPHMDQNVLGPQENQPIVHRMTMMILIMTEIKFKPTTPKILNKLSLFHILKDERGLDDHKKCPSKMNNVL